MSIGEKSKTKKESKHGSARKLLESFYKDYLFSEQKEPESWYKTFRRSIRPSFSPFDSRNSVDG